MKISTVVDIAQPINASLRCPACRQNGTFHGPRRSDNPLHDVSWQGVRVGGDGRKIGVNYQAGLRVCPNADCRTLMFVGFENGKVIESFPAERLDFDPKNIPQRIADSFEEAITAHANQCFKSAAIMVRRTLEEICADRGAKGRDLKDRLTSLRSTIVVPDALLEATDELRLLGNDAAHLEAKVYDDIGEVEVELAIELCKELLKATYQYEDLLGRLRALKKTPT